MRRAILVIFFGNEQNHWAKEQNSLDRVVKWAELILPERFESINGPHVNEPVIIWAMS